MSNKNKQNLLLYNEQKLKDLNNIFTPASPIKNKDFFWGRIAQLEAICDAINETGQHAILFGDRGVGKTSLANIMMTSFTNLYPVKVTCNRGDSFKTIWKKAISGISESVTSEGIGFKPTSTTISSSLINFVDVNSDTLMNDIHNVLKEHKDKIFLFIFDEFDNVLDKNMRIEFADLVKSFSDNIENVTVVLVGIADNVEDLIGSHLSLERCLKQIRMPRMSEDECSEIIENGFKKLDISVPDNLKKQIIEFSSGFPHYIHLLCKYGGQEIIKEYSNTFQKHHLKIAVAKGIENSNGQVKTAYRKATMGENRSTNKWKDVLFACAQASIDEFNGFSISGVVSKYSLLTKKQIKGNSIIYNLNQLCTKERGEILEKIGFGKSTRYRFINPLLRAFIKLKISEASD